MGRQLPILFARRRPTGCIYICEAGALGTVTLPEEFTDRGLPLATRPLTAEVLAELATTVRTLKRKLASSGADG
jgi:hypothetical protein